MSKKRYTDETTQIKIIKKGKNRYYSPKLKREMVDKVLLEGRSQKKCKS